MSGVGTTSALGLPMGNGVDVKDALIALPDTNTIGRNELTCPRIIGGTPPNRDVFVGGAAKRENGTGLTNTTNR